MVVHHGNVSRDSGVRVPNNEVDVSELTRQQEATIVLHQRTLGIRGQLKPVHFTRPGH